MAEKQKNELNEEQILAFLQDIVGKIQTEEDPLELNSYRRLFKKAVPFHLRSYFAAYLLKQINAGKTPRIQVSSSRNDRSQRSGRRDRGERNERTERNERSDRNDRSERAERSDRNDRSDRVEERGSRAEMRQREARPEESKRNRGEARATESVKAEPRPVLADDVSTTLFISIGRNRRVYPRDLIGLIMQNVEMEREHIGDIRVLDNYSFVQVITEDAEKIIAALNEFEYRGRKLAVSYSRKKEESPENDDSVASSDDSGMEADSSDFIDSAEGADSADAGFAETDSADAGAPDAGSWKDDADPADDEENNANI